MKALLQRVTYADVFVGETKHSAIQSGYVVFLGIERDDTLQDIKKLVEKIAYLRINADENGKMNTSILDSKGSILLISQFTLCANIKGGRRPDFFPAMEPHVAEEMYEEFGKHMEQLGIPVQKGVFGEHMQITLTNDGPVTFFLDSKLLT